MAVFDLTHAGGPAEVTVGPLGLTVLAELADHGDAVTANALAYRLGRTAGQSFRRETLHNLASQGLIQRYATEHDHANGQPASHLAVTELGRALLVCCECNRRARFRQSNRPACHTHADRSPNLPNGPFDPREVLVPRSQRNRSGHPVEGAQR